MSLRTQKILMWWFIALGVLYGLAFIFLFRMFPPPSAEWSAGQIARFYQEHSLGARVGAMIGVWTGGWFLPLGVVLGAQMYRRERLDDGAPLWTWLTLSAGGLMTVVIMLPTLFWGVAAYAPYRDPDVTAVLHEMGILTFITGTQYYIFVWVAIAVMSLLPNKLNFWPFPRWYGYFTILTSLALEAGALPFLSREGILAWNGLLPWWIPISNFFVWGTRHLLPVAESHQRADCRTGLHRP